MVLYIGVWLRGELFVCEWIKVSFEGFIVEEVMSKKSVSLMFFVGFRV